MQLVLNTLAIRFLSDYESMKSQTINLIQTIKFQYEILAIGF